MKKYGKFIILAVATFFSSILPCFAKQMTIDDLEAELKEKVPDAGYVYIIGEYAFTSEHTIDLTDIVLASDSINNKGDKTDKTQVNIYQLIRKYDGDYNAIGLEKTTNVIGTGVLPQTFDIRYIDYIHIGETTKTKVEFDVDDPIYETYKDVLEEKLGFETSEFYSGKLTNENGKIKGILLKKSVDAVSLNPDDREKYAKAQYFLAYIIEVPGATNETTIKKTGFDGSKSNIPLSAFDVPVGSKDKTPGIVILTPIDLEKIKDNKKIIYTIDLDGDKDLYDSYDYIIDLSEVTFQTDSSEKASIIENNKDIVSETDKNTFKKWNYNSDNVTLTKDENDSLTYHVSGKLLEQTLINEAFGEDEATGYFFDFTFILEGNESHKATVSQLVDKESGRVFKEIQESEFDEKGNLTALIRIDPSKDCSNADNCKVYYKVDLDGNGDEYLPVIYTIDFSKVTREKASLFEVQDVTDGTKFGDGSWFTSDYSVKLTKDENDSKNIKANGLLPLLSDDSNWDSEEKFVAGSYYMGLALKLTNAPGSYDGSKLEVTLGNNMPFIQNYDNATKTLYLLVGLTKDSSTKNFTITLDLDGNSEEYAPYEVTISYENVSFQSVTEINSTFGELEKADLADGTPAKAELDSYGFNFETIDELGITYDYGISGNLKEQTLLDAAGFKNNQGYFAPVKINVQMPEGFEKYKNKWTITLYDEEGNKRIVKPKDNEYEQGWLLVLFRFDEDKFALKDDNLHYEIDLDGNEKNYLPQEFTIPVNSCKFLKARKITFNYFDEKYGKATSETITAYQGEKIPETKIPSFSGYSYHEFTGWYNEGETIADLSKHYVQDRDEKYTAHFTINTDKFIEDKVTSISGDGNYTDILDISKTGNDITLKVLNQETEINTLKSILEENISYIFSRNEITKITLTIDEESPIVITYEDTVGNKLNDLFNGKSLLYNMATKTLTINVDTETLSKSVQIAEGKETFTIHFVSDVVGVHNETELGTALSSNEVSHIQILQDFSVSKAYDVSRDVVITGLHEGGNYTITADSEVTNIFNVTSGNVTIESVKLIDATNEAILLNGGTLTTKDVAIEYTAEALPETVEAGIKVEAGTLTATDMTFEKEHYNKPLVKAKDNSAKVTLTDISDLTASPKVKVEITSNDQGSDTKEEKPDGYKYYHNDSKNAKIYATELITHEGGARHHFIKYNYYNESVTPIDGAKVSQYGTFISEGKQFTMYGYTEKSYQILYDKNTIEAQAANDGVIKKDELKATSDKGYWVVYAVGEAPGAAEVKDKDSLLKALADSAKTSIYIPDNTTIDMAGESLEIKNNISIYTKSSNPATIKNIGKITISADDVSFNRINLEVNGESTEGSSLIEVKGKKFSFWQGGLKNTGDTVDYAIKYTNAESVVDIRYMGAGSTGFDGANITEAYIFVQGKITDGSDLYLNNFKTGPKGAIIINGFIDANKEDDVYGIRLLSNTFSTSEYAMKLTSSVSGNTADIRYGKGKIIVEYDDSHKEFSGINLLVDNPESAKANIFYKKDGSLESPTPPEDGSGINISTSVQSSSPIETSISGISKNADGTYSGTLTQDEDGNFYLPLVITSSELKDRVSKIKITDPNDKVTEYLYSTSSDNGYTTIANVWPLNALSKIETISEPAVSQNNGTMKINLEALKAVKTKDNKKVYTIAFDYDGDGTYDEPQTIDYTDVKTEEEIILDAAYNTKNANSFTVIKNNKIKSGTENYTFKVDLANGNKYYKENGQDIEQYSFKATSVGLETDTIYVVEKSANIDSPIAGKEDLGARPKLNDWTYFTHFKSVSSGIQELGLLTDIVPDNKEEIIDAITTVSRVPGESHTFEVKVNHERLERWLNGMYVDGKVSEDDVPSSETHDVNEDSTITLKVTLDANEEYINHIQTTSEFNIKNNEGYSYDHNYINVEFKDIDETVVKSPQLVFGTDNDHIQAFIQEGEAWWSKYTGSSQA